MSHTHRRLRAAALLVLALSSPAAPAEAQLRLEPLPTIGRLEGAGPDVFGRVIDVEMDSAGNVYVLDQGARALQVFDADGTFVRSIGGEGRGPGEMLRPYGLGWGPDGNLWTADPPNGRYSVFSPGGDFVTTHPRPLGTLRAPGPSRGPWTVASSTREPASRTACLPRSRSSTTSPAARSMRSVRWSFPMSAPGIRRA